MQSRDAEVAVVGAGFAGLAAARRLTASGRSVVVLEARDRVGGRVVNRDLGGGTIVEMGGQWIGPTQDRMYGLAGELGVDTFPTYEEGDEVAIVGGKRRRYGGRLPRMNPLVLADFAQVSLRIERAAKRVPLEAPWEAPASERWDRTTLATWLDRAAKTRTARQMLELAVAAVFATESASLSLLHFLFYVHSGSSLESLLATQGGAQQDRFVGGSQRLAGGLADALGDAVMLGVPVRRIVQDGDAVSLESDDLTARARLAIVTVPPPLAQRIACEPSLPAARHQLLQRLPMGAVTKVNIVYDEPWWRRDGLKGVSVSTRGPVTMTFDNSPPGGTPGVVVAFLEGAASRALARLAPEERRGTVLRSVAEALGPRAERPEAVHELDWAAEEWTRGCYGAHFTPGTWTRLGPVLRERTGRIHWAGTETSPVWNGYMEGAVRSGERAAGEVLVALEREAL